MNLQGVMRVRRRVTSMVVTVSVIFGICWGTDVVVYVIRDVTSYKIGPIPVTIANTMAVFNSAVNPFVYALLNHQFREKMKRMICCTFCFARRIHPTQELEDIQLSSRRTQEAPSRKSLPGAQGPSQE